MAKMEKIKDGSAVGHYFASADGSIEIMKNAHGSWVIWQHGIEIESYAIASNAIVHAETLEAK